MQDAHFSNLDLNKEYEFHTALTDGGICHVYGGNSLESTFSEQDRVTTFHKNIDPRVGPILPSKIEGTGQLFRKMFWLDVAERYHVYMYTHAVFSALCITQVKAHLLFEEDAYKSC